MTYAPVTFRNIATDANNTYKLDLGARSMRRTRSRSRATCSSSAACASIASISAAPTAGRWSTFNRIDDLVSPRVGVVVKPVENVSFYGSYSVSYLPSAGDQFTTLNPGTAIAQPEKFVNKEIGVKWDIFPRLQFTAAVYNLDRTNQRFPDPNNPGFFILSGETNTSGFETGLVGYVTDRWQVSGGYAYTDARIVGATSATIVPGNRVGLVPYHTFTLWNKYEFVDVFAPASASSTRPIRTPRPTTPCCCPAGRASMPRIFGKYRKGGRGKELRWQVNVENMFNTAYYSTADGNNNITPGSPRAIRGVLRANF